jgi:ribose-phosphate pyrophosphokinase
MPHPAARPGNPVATWYRHEAYCDLGSANPTWPRPWPPAGTSAGPARPGERFPDGELHVEVQETSAVRTSHLLQPTARPDAHLLELLLLADACRRAGVARLTAVVPYLGYARQDRRTRGGEPVGGRVVADLIAAARLDRVVAVDLHTAALEGFFSVPLEHLSAVPLLVEAVRSAVAERAVIVAPDLGAVKLAERYARALDRPVATVHKVRLSGEEVRCAGSSGTCAGRRSSSTMISTGGTISAAITTLLAAGCVPEVTVVATHALLVGPAVVRLGAQPIRRLVVTTASRSPAMCRSRSRWSASARSWPRRSTRSITSAHWAACSPGADGRRDARSGPPTVLLPRRP